MGPYLIKNSKIIIIFLEKSKIPVKNSLDDEKLVQIFACESHEFRNHDDNMCFWNDIIIVLHDFKQLISMTTIFPLRSVYLCMDSLTRSI